MKIAVIGGTGLIGSQITALLRSEGHDVRTVGRRSADMRADLVTGAGLLEALAGRQVVVNASNDASRGGAAVLIDGTKRLIDTARAAGVVHHVCISIVGCEHVPMRYFRNKAEQERIARGGDVPCTVVRSTQFHEFVSEMFSSLAMLGLLPLPRMLLQPVDSSEVASLVARVASADRCGANLEIAGPEIADVHVFARRWRARAPRFAAPVPIPLPGAAGRALRAGALTNSCPDVMGQKSFPERAAAD